MTRVQLTYTEWEFIGPYLPISEYGPCPERLRRQPFAALFAPPAESPPAGPTHLRLHRAKILQGDFRLHHTGGMYSIAIADVSSWTVGDLNYSDS